MNARTPGKRQQAAKSTDGGEPDQTKICRKVQRAQTWDLIMGGVRAAWPICIGYIPLGLAFGILAQKAGFDMLDIALMSVVVFAGSSQFIAVAMLGAGAAPASIVLTTFMVNLRHVLMSSALAVHLHSVSRWFLSLFAYGVTDESFAVNIVRFRDGGWHPYQALAVNHAANFTWIASTVLGGFGGQFIAAGSFGIDYALSAMFLCLLAFQLRGRIYALTALVSGALAIAVSLLLPGNSYVVIASVLGATAGFALKRYGQGDGGSHA
ncbi:MAG TPA: AzlC family ABC transporter permease [Methanotrichaceae archaeon]|nr:AzlC family ABC transporter permease [Methanotrichaceae archaeon]HQF17703.1 AzlC family ABC transporter permease [Methanotrichaceae archaeon]HQI92320.1 AzlC family ABC transporter permease [Methanotrichaceae archaeon]HQJ29416.1 AzlC family ABC transporter permease [Methanotrichaceae archaeon]